VRNEFYFKNVPLAKVDGINKKSIVIFTQFTLWGTRGLQRFLPFIDGKTLEPHGGELTIVEQTLPTAKKA
ncbi:MAG: hypothetical protein K0U66_08930, partial [Gammaproteobacteria bacterium]|nr:hypothetical protein [Gammaproteobacteria bacterium]